VRLNETAGTSEYTYGDVGIWVTQPSATQPLQNVIIDHCTTQFCPYLLAAVGPTSAIIPQNVTFMNCLFVEGAGTFRAGFLATECVDLTMFRNVIAYVIDRTPFVNPITNSGTVRIEYINNIAFNGSFGQESIILGNNQTFSENTGSLQPILATIVNNRYPATANVYPMIWHNDGIENRANQLYHAGNDGGAKSIIYQNLNTYNPIVGSEPISSGLGSTHGTVLSATPAMEADILNNVGARPNNRDTATARTITRLTNKTHTPQSTVAGHGGQPSITNTSSTFTEPASPNADDDGDGYTNIEETLAVRHAALLNA
jgi:hypothetical protein